MRAFITFCILSLSISMAFADNHGSKYWVVGSFKQLGGAISESRRITDVSGESASVARFEMPQGTLYRIVIPTATDVNVQKELLSDAGVEPWIVPVAADDLNIVDLGAEGMDIEFNLVVGAFSKRDRAEAFALDLNGRGEEWASVLESEDASVYRVAFGPYTYRKEEAETGAESLGINDAWWVAQRLVREVSNEVPDIVENAPMSEMEEPVAEPAPLRAPAPDESLMDYCIKRATPAERAYYCQDERFAAAAVAEQRVKDGAGGQTYSDFCAKLATPAQRKKYCGDETFSERLAPE